MFDREKYGRILVPMVTAFREDQNMDYDSCARIAELLIEKNMADSIIISGTTGEFFSMTFDERVQLFRVVYDAVGNKIPLIAGTACVSTVETIRLSQEAQGIGYETIMVACPYYTKPTQTELLNHFKRVAQAVDINITLYNIPIFTGVNLGPAIVSVLAEIDNIVAIKEEAEINPKQITAYINSTPEDFTIYCGDDAMTIEAFAQGGAKYIGGIISGGSHIIGAQIREMIQVFLSGEVEIAAQIQQELLPLFRSFGQNGRYNPVALIKEAMKLQGYPAGVPRLPLMPGTEAEIDAVKKQMQRLNVL